MVIFIYVLAGLGMGAWLVWGWGGIGLWDVVVVLRVDVPAGGLC